MYAREVIGLLSPYPGRQFKMIEIRRYVETGYVSPDSRRRAAIRIGVLRVLDELRTHNLVSRRMVGKRALYSWRQPKRRTVVGSNYF